MKGNKIKKFNSKQVYDIKELQKPKCESCVYCIEKGNILICSHPKLQTKDEYFNPQEAKKTIEISGPHCDYTRSKPCQAQAYGGGRLVINCGNRAQFFKPKKGTVEYKQRKKDIVEKLKIIMTFTILSIIALAVVALIICC